MQVAGKVLSYTERDEDGEISISIYMGVAQTSMSIGYSSPEYWAHFTIEEFAGLDCADAFTHPALIARFIETLVGSGKVRYEFTRRSDELARLLESKKDTRYQSREDR